MADDEQKADQEQAEEPEQHGIAGRCAACEVGFRVKAWHEGLKCPKCRAGDVVPLPVPGGAIDYVLADRSQGTTAHDVTFGLWAKWCDFITANQYNTAVHRQNSELHEGRRGRPLHEVMVSLDHLAEDKAVGILRFMAVSRPDRHDEDFVARLLTRPGVDADAVQNIAAQQRKMAQERNEVPPVCQLLEQAHVITETEMLSLLREEQHDKIGTLHVALSVSLPPPKVTAADKLLKRAKESPDLIRRVLLVTVIVALTILVCWWRLREPPTEVYAECGWCGSTVLVEWDSMDWPRYCPLCRHKTAAYAVICPNGHQFTRAHPFSREKCPVCGSKRGRPLTEADLNRPSRDIVTPRSAVEDELPGRRGSPSDSSIGEPQPFRTDPRGRRQPF